MSHEEVQVLIFLLGTLIGTFVGQLLFWLVIVPLLERYWP